MFGHIGIGRALVGARGRALPVAAFAFGAMLPDIIDKSCYYSRLAPDFFTCTRTVGHTGLFLCLLTGLAVYLRSRALMAAAAAVATHIVLDAALDVRGRLPGSTLVAFMWPFYSTTFWSFYFDSPADQFLRLWRPDIIVTETIGLSFLVWEYLKRRTRRT